MTTKEEQQAELNAIKAKRQQLKALQNGADNHVTTVTNQAQQDTSKINNLNQAMPVDDQYHEVPPTGCCNIV